MSFNEILTSRAMFLVVHPFSASEITISSFCFLKSNKCLHNKILPINLKATDSLIQNQAIVVAFL